MCTIPLHPEVFGGAGTGASGAIGSFKGSSGFCSVVPEPEMVLRVAACDVTESAPDQHTTEQDSEQDLLYEMPVFPGI